MILFYFGVDVSIHKCLRVCDLYLPHPVNNTIEKRVQNCDITLLHFPREKVYCIKTRYWIQMKDSVCLKSCHLCLGCGSSKSWRVHIQVTASFRTSRSNFHVSYCVSMLTVPTVKFDERQEVTLTLQVTC